MSRNVVYSLRPELLTARGGRLAGERRLAPGRFVPRADFPGGGEAVCVL